MTHFNFKRFVACICIAFFSLQISAQSVGYMQLESYFNNLERNDLAHGTIVFAKNGKTVYQKALGYQNIETKKETSVHTRYRIGSISKTFTAVMIMQLVEEGKLKLSTKLSDYFPQIPNAKNITIEHLLRHKSGLNEIVRGDGMEEWIQEAHTRKEILSQFVKLGSDFKPGIKQEYNNNGYVLLSYILEDVDKKPFHQILKERVTIPLKLNNTYYGGSMGTQKNEAISCLKKGNNWEKSTEVHPTLPLGAGGIVSTTENLITFFNELFNNKLISEASLQGMMPIHDSEAYGLGLINYSLNDTKAIGHTGGIDGFRSWLLYFPESKLSLAYTTNAQNKPFKELVKEVFTLFQKEERHAQLAKEIFIQDSLLFDAMFNKHDASYVKNNSLPTLEFYHDKGGKVGSTADDMVKTMERIWKKMDAGEKPRSRRELIRESFEVYPINNYGAMQFADHKFYEKQADGSELLVETAKIKHLWKKTETGWKLAKIVSYDHQQVATPSFEVSTVLEQKIKEWMDTYKVPAVSIGLINDGKVTYSKTFGEQENGTKATNNTIFKVASITKPVVATTVYKLVDMGLWDLDEPLYKYWIDPDISNDPRTKKITARLVLNMQTGLPNWRHLLEPEKLKFLFEPGKGVEYSGEGFEYLKKSIEAKFNTPLEDIVQKVLFDKQDMDNIRFWWDDAMDESLYAGNYNAEGKKYKTYKYKAALAAGNILASVDDYLKFGVHVIEGAGISNNLYAEMTQQNSSLFRNLVKYGNGWMSVKLKSGEKMMYHDGRDPGVRTIIQLYPQTKQGVVIFTNGDDGDKLYYEILKELSPNTKDFVDSLDEAKRLHIAEMKTKKDNSD